MNEFVNPKYVDSSKTAFKSATRLECMMQVRAGAQRGGRERWLVLWGTLA